MINWISLTISIAASVASIGGLILGIENRLWITGKRKSDERLELRKLISSIYDLAESLDVTMRYANGSKRTMLAAAGLARSSSFEAWQLRNERDKGELANLISEVPGREDKFTDLNDEQLADKSNDLHRIHVRLTRLNESYKEELRRDEKKRSELVPRGK